MYFMNLFANGKNWYKGNLHCHSTNSDGRLTPAAVAELYKKNGWNFLALTDHCLFTAYTEFNDENFLVLPGVEVDNCKPRPFRIYHAVGIAGPEINNVNGFGHMEHIDIPKWTGPESPQQMIDILSSRNALPIYCHPIWSRNELADFADLTGFFAMEIYNYNCDRECRTGLSVDYWDSLLRRGRKIWGVATDDTHQQIKDYCGGWVMVNAPELTHDAIVDALLKGSFYSSSGPEIYRCEIVDGEVIIECSPVKAIHFVSYEVHGLSCWADDDGGTITAARYKLKGTEKYVRVECVDSSGNTAWTNPFFFILK